MITPQAGIFGGTVSDDDLGAALLESGWAVAHLDGSALHTRRQVLDAVGEALGFPEWYGANLDALWDCLRDLVDPVVLVCDGWSQPALADADGFAAVLAVLRARAEESGDLMVLLRGDGPEVGSQALR